MGMGTLEFRSLLGKVGSSPAVTMMVRPDRVRLQASSGTELPVANAVRGEIVAIEYLGGASLVTVQTADGQRLLADVSTAGEEWASMEVGRTVVAAWDRQDVHVIVAETAAAPAVGVA